MAEKANIIALGVKSGITDLNSIRKLIIALPLERVKIKVSKICIYQKFYLTLHSKSNYLFGVNYNS